MSFESWGSYAMACFVLSLIPGPSVLLIIGQALSLGMRGAMACLAGALLGGLGLILGALAGLGAVLASSAVLFQAIKWAGIAYLLWLGVTQLRLARRTKVAPNDAPAPQSVKGSFRSGFLTALLNPKSLVFYLAFLSQFLDPAHSTWISYVQLIVTSIVIADIAADLCAAGGTAAPAPDQPHRPTPHQNGHRRSLSRRRGPDGGQQVVVTGPPRGR